MKPERPHRAAYRLFRPITTRWMDNDVYGHINNVVYYSFFDTVVNGWLVENGLLDIAGSPAVGLVVETKCNYFASLAFPERIEGGLRVDRIGGSSVTYGIGIFAEGAEEAAAAGHFVHVYVERESQRPTPVPDRVRAAMQSLVLPG